MALAGEIGALSSIFGKISSCSGTDGRHDPFSFDISMGGAILRVKFPELYPETPLENNLRSS